MIDPEHAIGRALRQAMDLAWESVRMMSVASTSRQPDPNVLVLVLVPVLVPGVSLHKPAPVLRARTTESFLAERPNPCRGGNSIQQRCRNRGLYGGVGKAVRDMEAAGQGGLMHALGMRGPEVPWARGASWIG